ncbi:MAG: hypothetical protein ACK4OK_10535 [Thermoflexus sp.]
MEDYGRNLRFLIAFLGDLPVRRISAEDLHRFLTEFRRERGPKTTYNRRLSLKSNAPGKRAPGRFAFLWGTHALREVVNAWRGKNRTDRAAYPPGRGRRAPGVQARAFQSPNWRAQLWATPAGEELLRLPGGVHGPPTSSGPVGQRPTVAWRS